MIYRAISLFYFYLFIQSATPFISKCNSYSLQHIHSQHFPGTEINPSNDFEWSELV